MYRLLWLWSAHLHNPAVFHRLTVSVWRGLRSLLKGWAAAWKICANQTLAINMPPVPQWNQEQSSRWKFPIVLFFYGFCSHCFSHIQNQGFNSKHFRCKCLEGYLGNGNICFGNILQQLQDLNSKPGGGWTGQLSSAITLFSKFSQFFKDIRCVRLHAALHRTISFWLEAVHAAYELFPTWDVTDAMGIK